MIIDKDVTSGIRVSVPGCGVYDLRQRMIVNENPMDCEVDYWESEKLLNDTEAEALWQYIQSNPEEIDDVQITKAEFDSIMKQARDEEDESLTRVVVYIAGGEVVSVASDNPNVAVLIVDTDIQGSDNVKTVKTYNTDVDFDCSIYKFDVDNAIEFVDHFFSEYDRVNK